MSDDSYDFPFNNVNDGDDVFNPCASVIGASTGISILISHWITILRHFSILIIVSVIMINT